MIVCICNFCKHKCHCTNVCTTPILWNFRPLCNLSLSLNAPPLLFLLSLSLFLLPFSRRNGEVLTGHHRRFLKWERAAPAPKTLNGQNIIGHIGRGKGENWGGNLEILDSFAARFTLVFFLCTTLFLTSFGIYIFSFYPRQLFSS